MEGLRETISTYGFCMQSILVTKSNLSIPPIEHRLVKVESSSTELSRMSMSCYSATLKMRKRSVAQFKISC